MYGVRSRMIFILLVSAWQPHCRSSANNANVRVEGWTDRVLIMSVFCRARLDGRVVFGGSTWYDGGRSERGCMVHAMWWSGQVRQSVLALLRFLARQVYGVDQPKRKLERRVGCDEGVFGVMTVCIGKTRLSDSMVPRGVCGAAQRNEPAKVKTPGQGLADTSR